MKCIVQLEVAGAYETPIEQYAREGKIVTGCLYGVHKKMTGPPKHRVPALDAMKNPIWVGNCGMMCDRNEKYCPRHLAMMAAKQGAKG